MQRLIADAGPFVHDLVPEGAVADDQTVHACGFYHMGVVVVADLDVVQHDVFGVRQLHHGVAVHAAVKNAALDGDVAVTVADCACFVNIGSFLEHIKIADAQQVKGGVIGVGAVVEGDAVERQGGVAVDDQRADHVVGACLHPDEVGVRVGRPFVSEVERVLDRLAVALPHGGVGNLFQLLLLGRTDVLSRDIQNGYACGGGVGCCLCRRGSQRSDNSDTERQCQRQQHRRCLFESIFHESQSFRINKLLL